MDKAKNSLAYVGSVRHDSYATPEEKVASVEAIPELDLPVAVILQALSLEEEVWQEVITETAYVLEQVMRDDIRSEDLVDARRRETVWQIDPYTCVACGNCATHCVLQESAVKCVHAYAVCGYCRICFGFFGPEPIDITEAAENQLCPTGAIKRQFVEDPYFQYSIDESLCIGCGKCVKGCGSFGNASLYLQVRHDRCRNCNECRIARECPSGAFVRLPISRPYLPRGKAGDVSPKQETSA